MKYHFTDATKGNPGDIDSHRIAAKEFKNAGDHDNWEKTLRAGLKKHPKNTELMHGLAKCLAETSRPHDAVVIMEKLFYMQPDMNDLATDYARLLQETGNLEMAEIIYLWTYNEEKPTHAKNIHVLRDLSALYVDMKDYESAVLCLGQILQFSPESAKIAKSYKALSEKHGQVYSDEKWAEYLVTSQELINDYADELPGYDEHDDASSASFDFAPSRG